MSDAAAERGIVPSRPDSGQTRMPNGTTPHLDAAPSQTVGWKPQCDCGKESINCLVLDPFCGSGTTLLVACQHGREAIGIELSPEYAALAERRIGRGLRPGTYVDEQDSSHHPLFT